MIATEQSMPFEEWDGKLRHWHGTSPWAHDRDWQSAIAEAPATAGLGMVMAYDRDQTRQMIRRGSGNHA